MDSFEDLENPPTSIQNVVNNRWLNSSFKETVSDGSRFSTFKFDKKVVRAEKMNKINIYKCMSACRTTVMETELIL